MRFIAITGIQVLALAGNETVVELPTRSALDNFATKTGGIGTWHSSNRRGKKPLIKSPNRKGELVLNGTCPQYKEGVGCLIYESPERPTHCHKFEIDSPQCIKRRSE